MTVDDYRQRIAEDLRNGMTAPEAAEKHFYSVAAVYAIAKEHGVSLQRGQKNPDRDRKIRALVKNGIPEKDIAILVGMHDARSVRRAVYRMRREGYVFKKGDSHDEVRCM